jgi:hypothetical protein
MEYFKYDYKNVDSEINFQNYETFLTDMRSYKFYLFDISLMQHDPKLPQQMRKKSKFIIFTQKVLFVLPYLIIFPTLYYYYRNNFFTMRIRHKEFKLISYLFGTLFAIRLLQKVLIKYEGDTILKDAATNNLHSV